jgi:hypothetical protein
MRFAPSPVRQFVILAAAVGLGIGVQPAAAQLAGQAIPNPSNPSTLGSGPPNIGGPPPEQKKGPAEPPALPGAASRADRVAPSAAGQIADPTEALFDAINRGDIASARDAIDRGADLGGQSVLGMTPLDLSVDLGRNDITFLLLSLRGADSRPRSAGSSQTARGTAQGAPPQAGKLAAATPAKPPARAPARPTAAARPVAMPVAQQIAGDSGVPDPAVGFLGFGPSR